MFNKVSPYCRRGKSMSPVVNFTHENSRHLHCKPSVQYRVNGRLFAVCSVCPFMRGYSAISWPASAPWPCKARRLEDD